MKSFFYLAALILTITLASATTIKDDKKPKPKFQRMVAFKFKTDASADARKKHMKGFEAFVKEVKQVMSYRAGKTVKGESIKEVEYDVMHYITFEKESDIVAYDAHPAHKKFVAENKDSWEKVLVVNGAIE
jgi:hypothetical protein